MKKIKIGEQEFEQAESIEDLNIKRWNAFTNSMIADEAGVEVPRLKQMFTQLTQEFDKQSMSGMYRAAYDFMYKLGQIQAEINPSQIMFALITFIPDEDRTSTDQTLLKTKLDVFAKAGLTQGQVKKDIDAFIGGLLIA